MAMFHCDHCWESPCVCGHEYRNWSTSQLKKQIDMLQGEVDKKEIVLGDSISGFFGLSYASWLTLPRVLMQDMPQRWQKQMRTLLDEFGETFPNVELRTVVRMIDEKGRFRKMEAWLTNYRYPDQKKLEEARRKPCRTGTDPQ